MKLFKTKYLYLHYCFNLANNYPKLSLISTLGFNKHDYNRIFKNNSETNRICLLLLFEAIII